MLSAVIEFVAGLFSKRLVIWQLARQDFRNRYLGSVLGFAWTFIQPLAMALILWTVFTVAFKANDIEGVPFGFYLLAGLAAWYFFSEALAMTTGVFQEYAFMVKKVNFRIAVLPLVKIMSCLMAHLIFLCIVMGLLVVFGRPVFISWLQIAYYLFAMMVLLVGLGWITSAVNVFVRDVAQAVNILLQFGFWLTPIVWHIGMVPEQYRWILKLNPLFYVLEGYRGSLLFGIPFWHDRLWTLYFWCAALLIFFVGALIFKRLKPHFADVL